MNRPKPGPQHAQHHADEPNDDDEGERATYQQYLAEMSREECGDTLHNYLVELKEGGKLSAKQACLLAYWASKAGACGAAAELAFAPGKRTVGHYSRHWDSTQLTREEDEHWLKVQAPTSQKSDFARVVTDIPVCAPHTAMAEEVALHAEELRRTVREAQKYGLLGTAYGEHPVVTSAVLPLALYCDSVPFTRSDSAIGFFLSIAQCPRPGTLSAP